jgi:ubiquinone/menaquinone biosynthesis C-methylase UbiE
MARLARENGSTSIAASAVEIPFGAGTFDAVLCIEMLQCVPESDTAVREMARVLKPGGRLVIQTLNRSSWARKFHRLFNSDYEKLRMFSVTELRAFDQLAPLKIQELYFNFYPLPFCCPCDGFAWLAKPVATSLVLVAEKKA